MKAIRIFSPATLYVMTFSLLLMGAAAIVHADVAPNTMSKPNHEGDLIVFDTSAANSRYTHPVQADSTDDKAITEKVKNELQKNVVTKGTDIQVEAVGGIVLLSGILDNSNKQLAGAQIATAGQLAANVVGADKVINNLVIKA